MADAKLISATTPGAPQRRTNSAAWGPNETKSQNKPRQSGTRASEATVGNLSVSGCSLRFERELINYTHQVASRRSFFGCCSSYACQSTLAQAGTGGNISIRHSMGALETPKATCFYSCNKRERRGIHTRAGLESGRPSHLQTCNRRASE